MQPEQAIRIPKRNQLSISYKNERADMQHHSWGKVLEYPSGSPLSHLSLSTGQVLVTIHSWCTGDV